MNAADEKVRRFLEEYESQRHIFEQLCKKCDDIITGLLKNRKVHSVKSRVKGKKNLEEKLTRDGRYYDRLEDVTDIVGVRVITHFESEVDDVGTLVEKEFDVDWENSVDKRKMLEADRFGYLSLHYVCSFSHERLRFPEYEDFEKYRFEIQIRSILQHAWAEIEHDLGYKSDHGLKPKHRRRFSRLAGLLELADHEFTAIRKDLEQYESEVRSEVKTSPAKVGIDKISLKAIFKQNAVVRGVDEELARRIGGEINENATMRPLLSAGLSSVGISTAKQLVEELEQHSELLLNQAVARFRAKGWRIVNRGTSVLQLVYVLMGLREGPEGIIRVMEIMGHKPRPEFAQEVMQQIQRSRGQGG